MFLTFSCIDSSILDIVISMSAVGSFCCADYSFANFFPSFEFVSVVTNKTTLNILEISKAFNWESHKAAFWVCFN
jgi:hypothetical protein